ncbi:hypothetical protein KFE80_02920 [bacterium SCSIO 12696]|nr:hypothetical protein KFE80_02920 [bacterium SCSIO 12696]
MKPSFCLEKKSSKPRGSLTKLVRKSLSELEPNLVDVLENCSIETYDLPFYNNIELVTVSYTHWQPKGSLLCGLTDGKDFWRLDGRSPPIHEVNGKAGINVNESTAMQYLTFFCFFVRGDEGPFFIVEHLGSPYIPDGCDINCLDKIFRHPQIFGKDKQGNYKVSSLVYYSDAIFFADFIIEQSGMIKMVDDHPVLADIGESIDAPLKVEYVLNS